MTLLELIQTLKANLITQGTDPKYLWCSQETRKLIHRDCAELLSVSHSDFDGTKSYIEGLEIQINDEIKTGQLFITGEEFDIKKQIEHSKIMQTLHDAEAPELMN